MTVDLELLREFAAFEAACQRFALYFLKGRSIERLRGRHARAVIRVAREPS